MKVADIAKRAMDAVQAKITDAIHAATLSRDVQGAYDPVVGAYAITTYSATGRVVVDTVTPVADIFPDYVIGPSDQLVMLEGFTTCAEADRVTFAGIGHTVRRVQDIVAAGTLFYAVVRGGLPPDDITGNPGFIGQEW